MTKVTSGVASVSSADASGLDAIPYLASLSTRERTDLARRCRVRAFAKGAIVFSEGHAATGVWVVLSGRVRLVRSSPRGREQVLHTESAGATLAEVPVFDGGGYVATAVAEDDARLLFVPGPELLTLCRRRPEVAFGVIAVLARRLRRFAALIEDLALRDVTARLSRFIVTQAPAAPRASIFPGHARTLPHAWGPFVSWSPDRWRSSAGPASSRWMAAASRSSTSSASGRGRPPDRSMMSEKLTTR